MSESALLSGNEAIARGAWEAGVLLAAAYPGTPSTEILENLAVMEGVFAEWAPNEKVAYEVAYGASVAGVRALVTMKHVGVNVAADPLFTSVYTGVGGGLVLVSADDPGMHSSQNEQDNRRYAPFAKIPMLEPADSEEARRMTIEAFRISEEFDLPVMLRVTTRISHSKTIVSPGARVVPPPKPYQKDVVKYVMVPAFARVRRVDLARRLERVTAYAEASSLNVVERDDGGGEGRLGVVASGVAYQYAKEAFGGRAAYFKLGMTFPLPIGRLREFAARVDDLLVVEELDPYLEEAIAAAGIRTRSGRGPVGKAILPSIGEFSPRMVREAAERAGLIAAAQGAVKPGAAAAPAQLPDRPPVLCPGCAHRSTFWVLRRLGAIITGDIGCYTLGAAPPLASIDTTLCMGASISAGHGLAKAQERIRATAAAARGAEGDAAGWGAGYETRPVIAVIGDSTFFHSGVTGLMDVVYNHSDLVTVVMDNRTTGMTGHQQNPGTGRTLQGEESPIVNPEDIARAVGVPFVETADPMDVEAFEAVMKRALASGGPALVVARHPCALLRNVPPKTPYQVDAVNCNACRACTRIGCPAVEIHEDSVVIDQALCRGCAACVPLCKQGAISGGGEAR
jgi:indolepyruvate ferredoxin oxidoreductase alpha subunit